MKLSDFDYILPKELIAQYPLKERDAARLLVLNRSKGTIEHRTFGDIANYFSAGDLLVLNDTKVLPARLIGKRATGGRVEILLLNQKTKAAFNALIKPSRVKLNERIIFDGGKISCEISAKNEVVFNTDDSSAIYAQGVMPLPPYIKREPVESDNIDYQTVYAKNEGAVASPTAGLHFTDALLKKIESSGVNLSYLVLHVGHATFKPVKLEDITGHKMEKEEFMLPGKTIKVVRDTKKKAKNVIAVGTTTTRALETAAEIISDYQSSVSDCRGFTELFIYPGYKFKLVDSLITNFHLPRTTLFMLVCAFAGRELIEKAYQEAIGQKYRFYSYGDAMLIL